MNKFKIKDWLDKYIFSIYWTLGVMVTIVFYLPKLFYLKQMEKQEKAKMKLN